MNGDLAREIGSRPPCQYQGRIHPRVNEQCAAAGIDFSTTTQHSVTGELLRSGKKKGPTTAD
jgi:hypothetical protein